MLKPRTWTCSPISYMNAGAQILVSFSTVFPCALPRSRIRCGAAGTKTSIQMGCQHCRQWRYALCHNASPRILLSCVDSVGVIWTVHNLVLASHTISVCDTFCLLVDGLTVVTSAHSKKHPQQKA